MLSAGQAIDRWLVEATLGEGGMAMVYLVRHITLGTPAALKVLTMHNRGVQHRFLEEGRAQAGLKHPNVVGVLDVLEVDGSPALLLEYVDGPTLETVLDERRLSLDAAEAVFRGIVAGVDAAHTRGLVHRDLKPGNILMDGLTPKVADFGLVKVLGNEQNGITRTGSMMGTPAYIAPEQIRDAKSVDARADIFSLGCILYHLCTGRQAFNGDSTHEVLHRVMTGEYEMPEHWAYLPPRLGLAIRGALALDPAARIQSCQQLLSVLDGGEFVVGDPTATPSHRPPTRRAITPTQLSGSLCTPPPPRTPVPALPLTPPALPTLRATLPPPRATAPPGSDTRP